MIRIEYELIRVKSGKLHIFLRGQDRSRCSYRAKREGGEVDHKAQAPTCSHCLRILQNAGYKPVPQKKPLAANPTVCFSQEEYDAVWELVVNRPELHSVCVRMADHVGKDKNSIKLELYKE